MRSTPPKSWLFGALILISAHAVGASTTPGDGILATPTTLNVPLKNSLDTAVFESLRRDVAVHPNDFLTFETQTTAKHFIFEHADAFRETDRRVIQRGILGYWRGKMLVVLPSLSIGNHL
jgi:hypothetical protein